jgi:hypothetical protein
MKKVAIVQSNYIPWKGYFDLIAAVDEFILYDDAQYTRQNWRNRNRVKSPQGVQWLTVPVKMKGKFPQPIRETSVDGVYWREKHWKTLIQNYRRAPHFWEIAAFLEPLYRQERHTHLSDINRTLIESVCRYLGIRTRISNSWAYTLVEGRTRRIADLCAQAGGSEYVTGPSARNYLDEGVFTASGIQVTWFDFSGYPEYPQFWGSFRHDLTILDLLFNCGKNAPRFMKHIRP